MPPRVLKKKASATKSVSRQFFGTDGIRGVANQPPMTAELAMRVAMAAGHYFRNGHHRHTVVIGKDTRLSGYLIEPAMVAGFIATGVDVILVGPMPTPAVAMLTRSLRADMGVMISASHNHYLDNGIKLFGPDGFKLSDEIELKIEKLMNTPPEKLRVAGADLGRARRLEDEHGRYIECLKASLPKGLRLDGLKIVVDCANGAAYRVAPQLLWELGAEVVKLGVEPNGTNINEQCGAVHPQQLQQAVVTHKAHIGIALDGDADRLIVVDEKGRMVDGDQIIALIATALHAAKQLTVRKVVSTIMSNYALEAYCKSLGLELVRTAVGDRYVLDEMRRTHAIVGGEPSGHIILSEHTTTGDGLMAALAVLSVLVKAKKPASKLLNVFTPTPQVKQNVRFKGADPLQRTSVKKVLAAAEQSIRGKGRIVVRKSGTEPVIRIMAEGDDVKKLEAIVADIAREIAA